MNVIDLVTKYLAVLDEQYRLESISAILDTPAAFVQQTKDAKKVKIAKIAVDGLADYSRNGGFTTGSMDLSWEEHEFTMDRGRALQVDALDNMETFGMAFGRLAGTFQRERVIPEIDAYRFSEYYQYAGTKVAITVAAGAIMKFIDNADAQMDDDEVPAEGRILFVNPQVYTLMMNDPAIQKHINTETVTDINGISKKFFVYNNHRIIKVPSPRFLTKITFLDGKTPGQEAGGYVPAPDASVIGMLMIHPSALVQISKRRIARIWAPTKEEAAGTDGVNPDADAWKFDFRVYHDVWALENKISGIYAATIAGDGISYVTAETGSYNSGTGVWTAGGTDFVLGKADGTTYRITGTIPYADEDVTLGLAAGNRLSLRIVNSSITSQAGLPSGNICKITNLLADSGFNTYTKEAFETDGSLIIVANTNINKKLEAKVTWASGLETTYVFDYSTATLAAAE